MRGKESSSFPLVGLAFLGFILIGAMGGASGIVLPSQIAYYHVNTSTIGLLSFTFSTGYVLSAGSTGFFIQKIGQHRYLTCGAAICVMSTFTFSLRPPFSLALLTNLFLGFGTAVIDTGFNALISSLPRRTKLLNYLHAFYGTGALLGPLVASAFLSIHWEWNTVYLVWCGLSLLQLIGCIVLLRAQPFRASVPQNEQYSSKNVLGAVLKIGPVWLAILFLFLYVGLETSVGNWSYSFLLTDRHQTILLAGWIVSGYWSGLTLGRFLVNTIAERFHLGIEAIVYYSLAGTGIGGLLVWLLPGGEAAMLGICLIGFFLGPLFASIIVVVPRLVPSNLVPSTIGLLLGTSVVGGAFFPWLVGTLAQYIGIWILLPSVLVLTTLMCANWWTMIRRMRTQTHGHADKTDREAPASIEDLR
ncbi:MAG TPA: MFS transporter [Ktedonobacteraceae bacterium]